MDVGVYCKIWFRARVDRLFFKLKNVFTYEMKLCQNAYNWVLQNKYVIGILFFAACLRFPGFLHGLPTYPDADEPVMIAIAIKIFKGQFNPHFFYYPSLFFYLNAVFIACTHIVYHSLHALGIAAQEYTPYWLFFAVSRFANIIFSLTAVFFIYKIGLLYFSKRVGLFSMFILAILPYHIYHSVRAVPDSLMMTMTVISIYFSLKYLKEPKVTWLYSSAIFAGLAIGTKYIFPVPLAFILAKYFNDKKLKINFWDMQLCKAIGLVILTFLFTTPYLIFSANEFLNHLFFNYTHYRSSSAGSESEYSLLFYLKFLFTWGVTPLLFIASVAGIIYTIANNTIESIVLFSVPIVWLLFCSFYTITALHVVMIITLPFVIGAGVIVNKITTNWSRWLIIAIVCIIPLFKDIKHIACMKKPDIRYSVEQWINTHLSSGSVIAREEYTPFYDENKFTSIYIGICGLAFITPDMIRKKGYDYIISASHDRFLNNPKKHAEEIENYNNMLREFEIIKEFDPGQKYRGSKIQIFKID